MKEEVFAVRAAVEGDDISKVKTAAKRPNKPGREVRVGKTGRMKRPVLKQVKI